MFWRDDKSHGYLATLDGSQHAVVVGRTDAEFGWPEDRAQSFTYGWARDKRARALVPPNTHAIVVHLWDRKEGRPLGLRVFSPPANYHQIGSCALLPDGNLATNSLKNDFQFKTHPPVMLYHITPAPNSVVHSVARALPAGTTVKALIYSPHSDRLAWLIDREWPSPLAFLHRWFPKFVPASRTSTSLWVSGTLGENLHEIGHLPVPAGGHPFHLLDYLRWKPDGKTLSFVSRDTLYTVPAD